MAAAFKGACRRAREREKTAKTAKSVRKRCVRICQTRKIAQLHVTLQQQRMQVLRCQEFEQSFFACRVGANRRENRPLSRSKVSRSCFVFRNTHHRFTFAHPGSRALFAGPVIFAGSRFAPAAPRCDDGVVRGQKEVTWQN